MSPSIARKPTPSVDATELFFLMLIMQSVFELFLKIGEPVHEISNKVVCATSKASDQPAHTRSLIRAFASR